MKYTGRLFLAFCLSFLIHVLALFYLERKPIEDLGVPSPSRVKTYQVRIVTEDPIPSGGVRNRETERKRRERRIREALLREAERREPMMPEPEPFADMPAENPPVPPEEHDTVLSEPTLLEESSLAEAEALPRIVAVPEPRVEPPQPESRLWIPPRQDLKIPSLPTSQSLPPAPDLFEPTSRAVSPPSVPPPDRSVSEDRLSDETMNLPDEILIEVSDPVSAEEWSLPDSIESVTNWDDYLEVDVDTYRPDETPGYFRISIRANEKAKVLRSMYKDVLFAIDASGSMDREDFDLLKKAVADSLSLLRKRDRFNVIGFKADVVALNPSLWPVRPQTLERARRFILGLEPSGKTDIYRSLSSIAQSLPPGDRPFLILLFSDGMPTVGVKDSRDLINLVTIQNHLRAGIHAVGVGSPVNRYLLGLLAYRNKGFTRYIRKREEIARVVPALLEELSEPMLMDLSVDLAGFLGEEAYPKILPDLFRGGTVEIYGRYDQEKELVLRLTGNVRGRMKDFVFRGMLPQRNPAHREIAFRWAASKAYELVARNCAEGDVPERTAQIRRLSDQYALEIPF